MLVMSNSHLSIKGCQGMNVKQLLSNCILFDITSTLIVFIISDCVKMGHQVIVEGYYDMVTLGNALHVIIAIQAGHG